jgi:nitronate monooxygenase
LLTTAFTRSFGCTVPLVGAPMAGASGSDLAAAVSGAGGLGMIAAGGATSGEWIARNGARAAESGRPYGVGLLAWSRPEASGQLDAVLALDPAPALVSVSYGAPAGDERRHLAQLQAAGLRVATQVGDTEDTLRALDAGVDVLVARGGEGGGHGRDTVATLPLLQAVLELVPTGPARPLVLAAGGIATGRGVAAVLAAGADAAWVGTALLACPESTMKDAAKERLLAAGLTGTVYTRAFDRGFRLGWPDEFGGRALRNRFTDTWTGRESELADAPEASAELDEARGRQDYDVDHVYAGQSVALVQRIRPAAEVVAQLAAEAETLLTRW